MSRLDGADKANTGVGSLLSSWGAGSGVGSGGVGRARQQGRYLQFITLLPLDGSRKYEQLSSPPRCPPGVVRFHTPYMPPPLFFCCAAIAAPRSNCGGPPSKPAIPRASSQ